jgi:glycosyltransferase involved in cell wall biosynthesis
VKILHLLYESKGDYFGIGGVGIRAYEIYRYLRDRHEITLLCRKYPGAVDGEMKGLNHIFVGTESSSLTRTLLSYAWHAAQFVNRHGNEFDVIIEEFSPAIPTFLHAFTKKPVILQVQGYTGKLYFRKYNPFYALALYSMESVRPRFYDNFIFVSPETAKNFSLTGETHVAVISNGISPGLLSVPPHRGSYILYLGRLDIYGKGLDLLLSAYREFYKSFPAAGLVIAGDGRDRKMFQAELMRLPPEVRNNIQLRGWVSGEQKVRLIMDSLFAVFPSRHEVQPIAVLEAMASEKPVVVSDIPEFNFVVEHGAGMSFRTGDALSLARTMTDLADGSKREEMGKKGRNWVEDFTWDKIALTFESFLLQVLGQEQAVAKLTQ